MENTTELKDTCLYMHTREDDGGIFYVGIGDEKRPKSKYDRNDDWHNTVNKHGYDVKVLVKNLTWSEACDLEIKMIAFYGRKDLGLGCLVNRTGGGQGAKGRIWTEEERNHHKTLWADTKKRELLSEKVRKPIDIVIAELKVIYGDRYDYSKIVYISQNHKITLVCDKHNDFEQWPANLLKGIGCQTCSREDQSKLKRKSQNTFIEQSKVKHGGKYDYSKVVYKGGKYEVEIVCPEHGSFFPTAHGHVNNGNGCKECGKIKISESQKKIKSEDRHSAKKVIDLETGKIYGCAKEAAEMCGINQKTLYSWLSGKRTNKTSLKYL